MYQVLSDLVFYMRNIILIIQFEERRRMKSKDDLNRGEVIMEKTSVQALIKEIRQKNPLIHNITNIVVANFSANGLLALGASPVMADAVEEVSEMASAADAVVLNMGTLNRET